MVTPGEPVSGPSTAVPGPFPSWRRIALIGGYLGCFAIVVWSHVRPDDVSFWIWDLAMLVLFAAFVLSVQRYSVYRRELRFFREFHDLSQAMDDLRRFTPDRSASLILETVVRTVDCDRAILYQWDEARQALVPAQALGVSDEVLQGLTLRGDVAEPALAVKVFRQRAPMLIKAPERVTDPDPQLFARLGSGTAAIVPIASGGAPTGVLVVDRADPDEPLDDDEMLQLLVLADQAGIALQNLKLHRELAERADQLQQKSATLARELAMARVVQDSVLPREAPQTQVVRYAAYARAALEIGGDFYHYLLSCRSGRRDRDECVEENDSDCAKCEKGRHGVLIGDASGKGIPAALVMAMVSSLLHERAERGGSPDKVLTGVNRAFKRYLGAETRFHASACLAYYDPDTRHLVYANAGHEPPLYWCVKTGTMEFLESTGTLLGLFRESDFGKRELVLAPGDRLIFYTDGVIDQFELTGAADGVEAWRAFARERMALDEAGFVAEVRKFVESSAPLVNDDLTVVIMGIH